MNELGVSGSTILSDEKRIEQLFEYGLSHIEIGEFKSKKEYHNFLNRVSNSLVSFAVHSPIIRGRSKYDIIEHVHYSPQYAIEQIAKEAKEVKADGGKYLLVHFPFFAGACSGDADIIIEDGLKKLKEIQDEAGIKIVCEPKLGAGKSPKGIEYLHAFPVETWAKYGLKICIDIGDYVMAAGDERALEYIDKWRDFIKVVHLHNVDYDGEDYFWKPMHPDDEGDGHHKMEHIVKHLAELDNIYFVMEHTPHGGYGMEYVMEGVRWVEEML